MDETLTPGEQAAVAVLAARLGQRADLHVLRTGGAGESIKPFDMDTAVSEFQGALHGLGVRENILPREEIERLLSEASDRSAARRGHRQPAQRDGLWETPARREGNERSG